jgi:hypothetical protein
MHGGFAREYERAGAMGKPIIISISLSEIANDAARSLWG